MQKNKTRMRLVSLGWLQNGVRKSEFCHRMALME
jgi:hypothetical protein